MPKQAKTAKAKKKPAPVAKTSPAPPAKPGKKTAAPPPAPVPPPAKAAGKGAEAAAGKGGKPGMPPPRKPSKKSSLHLRKGPGGEPFVPGDLLLPLGPQSAEEIQYLIRGSVCAERPAGEAGVVEVMTKRGIPESDGATNDLNKHLEALRKRFDQGAIEPLLPARPVAGRRTFQSVVDRARYRRREIGAFLRGLDIGRTETSHMDSHGEASLQSLMEWAARLENLVEAEEPEQADYAQFHRGLDQLEHTTEALIIDVELTLRRLRDRNRNA